MPGFAWFLIIALIVVVIAAGLFIAPYNAMVRMRNTIQESWRQVDVELNRRYELLPNLVETVRGYAAHERNTLEDVIRLRNQAASMGASHEPSQQRSEVEQELSGAVQRLMVTVEAYPDLKSNQNFLALQNQLVETEDRIAAGRRYYNANVRAYNTKVEQFPSNLVAGMFNFTKATYFEVNDQAVRQTPDVNFGEISYREGQQQQQPGVLPPSQAQPGLGQGFQAPADPLGRPQQAQQPPYANQPQPDWNPNQTP